MDETGSVMERRLLTPCTDLSCGVSALGNRVEHYHEDASPAAVRALYVMAAPWTWLAPRTEKEN